MYVCTWNHLGDPSALLLGQAAEKARGIQASHKRRCRIRHFSNHRLVQRVGIKAGNHRAMAHASGEKFSPAHGACFISAVQRTQMYVLHHFHNASISAMASVRRRSCTARMCMTILGDTMKLRPCPSLHRHEKSKQSTFAWTLRIRRKYRYLIVRVNQNHITLKMETQRPACAEEP